MLLNEQDTVCLNTACAIGFDKLLQNTTNYYSNDDDNEIMLEVMV